MNRSGTTRQLIFRRPQGWAALCAGLLAAGTGLADTAPADTVCTGDMGNGWSFSARSEDGRFDKLVWTRAGQPDQVSDLTYYATNAEGQPVWRGAFAAATKVVLVDLSGGSVGDGSQVSVHAEEWGWATGTCRGPGAEAGDAGTVQRKLIGLRDTQATNWLRRNGFSLARTVTHSGSGKTEHWSQADSPAVEIVFDMGFVSDVVPAAP